MEIQQKWVALNKRYSLYAPSPEAVQAMYQLKEELEGLESEQAARILTELYLHLHQYEEALEVFMSVMNRKNKADLKKQWSIQEMINSPIRLPVIKPLIKVAKRKKTSDLPVFTYHQDPVRTQILKSGFLKTCSCCGRQTDIWYAGPFIQHYLMRRSVLGVLRMVALRACYREHFMTLLAVHNWRNQSWMSYCIGLPVMRHGRPPRGWITVMTTVFL